MTGKHGGSPLAEHGIRTIVVIWLLIFAVSLVVADALVVTATSRNLRRHRREIPGAVTDALRACQEPPHRWTAVVRGRWRFDAYDPERAAPRGDDAPPLDAELLRRWRAGEPAPVRVGWLWGMGSGMLLRPRDGGSCGLLQITFAADRPELPHNLAAALGSAFGLASLGALLTIAVLVRPAARRLRRLREAADSLGRDDGYRSAADGVGDDIGAISGVLDAAHARALRDADLLRRRAAALENHLSDLAHDVRTPLASLQLALERAGRSRDLVEARAGLGQALDEAVYLGALLENLQLRSRLLAESGLDASAGTVCDLGRIVDMLGLRFGVLGEQRGVEVAAARPDLPILVRGDPTLIERAIGNLVHNSLVHGAREGHVSLLLETLGDGRFRCTVEDDGPGISDVALQALAAQGGRPRAATGARGGLGLAIAHAVFARLGWDCALKARVPHGLRVDVTGPLCPGA